MCLSKAQCDDGTIGASMCLLKAHDGVMPMCLWNSQDDEVSMFRLSTSHNNGNA